MRRNCAALAVVLLCAGIVPAMAAAPPLSAADQAAAFKAAGFKQRGKAWHSSCEDPGTASYVPGEIEPVGDLNGDGRPDALITESSTYCYGDAGTAFWLVSKQANGRWTLMANETGMATFLAGKGAGGWPDIEVGGPGFCFPVVRWDGRQYRPHGHQYDGKPCTPG
ncbi:MAG: hypothetical protein U1E53_17530 [Dongiaceae bacterium]